MTGVNVNKRAQKMHLRMDAASLYFPQSRRLMRAYTRGNQTMPAHLTVCEKVYHKMLPLDGVEGHEVQSIQVLVLPFGAVGAKHERAATSQVDPGCDSMPRYDISP
jgi:hypothetical protein